MTLTWSSDDLPSLLVINHILRDVQLHSELVPAVLLHLPGLLLLLLHPQAGEAEGGPVWQEGKTDPTAHPELTDWNDVDMKVRGRESSQSASEDQYVSGEGRVW